MVDALTGKRVRVVRGPHRGYMGTVQHANDTHVRMELDASNKVITIKREYVDADDGRGAGARRTARSMQTPMRAHMTPAYVPEFARASSHRGATDVSWEDDCPRLECKECTHMASAVHVSCSAHASCACDHLCSVCSVPQTCRPHMAALFAASFACGLSSCFVRVHTTTSQCL